MSPRIIPENGRPYTSAGKKSVGRNRLRSAGSPGYAPTFEAFGVSFRVGTGAELQAHECPFCDGDRFYLNSEDGLW
ncbi:MAG: hypothetical protein ACYTG0_30455, partial [Planctomycetota bacterium]